MRYFEHSRLFMRRHELFPVIGFHGLATSFLIIVTLCVVDAYTIISGSSQCIVRDDCSYAIQVVKPAVGISKGGNEELILEGSPVSLMGNHLDCKSVKQTSSSSWELDYDILTLEIAERHLTNSSVACVMSWTANNDIFLQETSFGIANGGDTHAASTDQAVTTFPSFAVPSKASSSPFLLNGRLSWFGSFMQGRVNQGCTSGTRGGPCVLYELANPSHGTVVVLSPLNQFLVTTYVASNANAEQSSLNSSLSTEFVWGASTMATMKVIPKGYKHSFVALIGQDGITDTMNLYGRYMRREYKLTHRMSDITIQTLGYQTDNGAQLCFCKYMCDVVLLATLQELIQHQNVPVRYLSFQNAWWPTSHSAPWCVSDWSTWTTDAKGRNTKFPMSNSVSEFIQQLPNEIPVQLYAPYFCDDTVYTKDFKFLASNTSLGGGLCHGFDFRQISPGQSLEFYSWLFQKAKSEYGMISYELDFVNQNLNCIDEFTTNVESAKLMFDGMAAAAQELGLAMQWCYANPSAALQSLNYPSMTNMRASFDFYYGDSWDTGTSSLFLWAMHIAPSTDTFWTSDNGNVATTMGGCDKTKGCPQDHSDVGCELHTILAIMSTGPVGFSDAIGQTNVARLMKTCRADGILLQPNKPLTPFDGHLDQRWRVLQTYSGPPTSLSNHDNHSGINVWAYYIVAHRLTNLPNRQVSVHLRDLWPRPRAASRWFIVWDHDNEACTTDGASAEQCGEFVETDDGSLNFHEKSDDYQAVRASIFATVPCSPRSLGTNGKGVRSSDDDNSWVLLGEVAEKYVSVSNQRFRHISCEDNNLRFSMEVILGETVKVSAINSGKVWTQTYSFSGKSINQTKFEGPHIVSLSMGAKTMYTTTTIF